jgi:hypothetical protein
VVGPVAAMAMLLQEQVFNYLKYTNDPMHANEGTEK